MESENHTNTNSAANLSDERGFPLGAQGKTHEAQNRGKMALHLCAKSRRELEVEFELMKIEICQRK
jgi:hypothetical protein